MELDSEQAENATLIAAIGVRRGLPARAVSIALATAYQESKIGTLPAATATPSGSSSNAPRRAGAHRSRSATPTTRSTPSSTAFFDGLAKIPNDQTLRITEAAQKVKRSGYPEAYQAHAPDARLLASVRTGYSPGGVSTCVVHQPTGHGTGDASGVAAGSAGAMREGW